VPPRHAFKSCLGRRHFNPDLIARINLLPGIKRCGPSKSSGWISGLMAAHVAT
jgi:hypothetical protein